tara:strand:- start:552 stop:1121 length:570 start_codon:yes stop_codon:yes gene_type:complete
MGGIMKNKFIQVFFPFAVLMLRPLPTDSLELVIGEERIEPGIIAIFEGAIKDHIKPESLHLEEALTQVHIEARVNWDEQKIPAGAPGGGYVPYLHITALVTNQNTGLRTFIDLLPHLNLIDNFHYARNISLPGSPEDLYTVRFNIVPPADVELGLHKDWVDTFGKGLFQEIGFQYTDVDFSEIASASRR